MSVYKEHNPASKNDDIHELALDDKPSSESFVSTQTKDQLAHENKSFIEQIDGSSNCYELGYN